MSPERQVELDVGLVVAGHGRHYIVETPEGRRLTCHPRGEMNDEHDDVRGYRYESNACLSCHPTGREDGDDD